MNRVIILFDNGKEKIFYLTNADLELLRVCMRQYSSFSPEALGSDSVHVDCSKVSYMKVIVGDAGGEE